MLKYVRRILLKKGGKREPESQPSMETNHANRKTTRQRSIVTIFIIITALVRLYLYISTFVLRYLDNED